MQVKLTRITSSHDNLRTTDVVGEASAPPTVGHRFVMTAAPLEAGDIRIVDTSPVQSVEADGDFYTFRTLNSVYTLSVLPEGNTP
jgi:hypothetical protein